MVRAEVRRTAITDAVEVSAFTAATFAEAIAKVTLDKYAEGFADGSKFAAEKMAVSVELSLTTAADLAEAYRVELERAQSMLSTLTRMDMENEDTITRGRMFSLETLHYSFSPIMEGEGLDKNEPPNPLLYTPAQLVYANGFLAMICLHALKLATVDPNQARELMMEAIEQSDEVMLTTEGLGLDMDVDKLNPA